MKKINYYLYNCPSSISILKSECIYLIDNLYKDDIETVVNNFIDYYNNDRLQEKIKELAPIEFRNLTLSASFKRSILIKHVLYSYRLYLKPNRLFWKICITSITILIWWILWESTRTIFY